MKRTITTKGYRPRMCFLTDRFAVGRLAIVTLVLICMLFISLTGLSIAYNPEPLNPAASTALHGKVFKTIIVADYYPYSFVNEKGIPDGFSVNIARAVAQVMDLKVEIGVDTWENAQKALEKGSIDFLPMMAYSSERLKSFDFSVPHTIAYDSVFVRKGTLRVKTLEDLSGKTVIIMNRDAAHDYLLSSGMSDKIKLVLVDDLPDMLRLLASGKGDAVIIPKLVGLIVLKKFNITNVEESSDIVDAYNRPFSFAVKKGNTTLLERLSQGLTIVKTTGQYDDIYKKWFGVLEPRGLPWKTVLKYAAGIAAVFSFIGMCLLFWSVSLQKQVALRTKSLEAEILERKKTENALRDSEQRFRSLFEDTPVAYQSLDEEGSLVDVNQYWLGLLGYTREEVIGRNFADFWSHDTKHLFDSCFKQFKKQNFIEDAEISLLNKNSQIVQVILTGKSQLDNRGKFNRTHCIIVDITKRKRLEEAQRRLSTAVEQAAEGILITDTQGTIQYVNPSLEHISGYDKTELLGTKSSIFKSDEHDQEFFKGLWETINAGKVWIGRFTNKRKDGTTYYVDTTISPVRDSSGTLINFVAVERDVTEHLELAKQLLQAQKMEAVGTLAGGIAHDFNNLLQAVLGYSEFMLQRKKEGGKDYSDLQKIHQAGQRGADLVKSLMTFSRKIEIKHVPVNLNQEILQVQGLLSRTIPKTIMIDPHLSADLEPIQGDSSQINQILMNLGINARDAMPDGGTLTIETANIKLDEAYCSTHLEAKPGIYVLLTVSDTGQGMDKETMGHIFEPFFSTKEAGKGTGLGLSTVYGIVKQHEGHIMCYSEPGNGTTFKIYFPAIQAEGHSAPPTFEEAIRGGTETVLLVDDDEVLSELGTALLNRFGYEAITAGNGKEALEIYQREGKSISLVILDLIMPEMDGRECLAEILRIDPNAKILIASGYSESGPANGAVAAGAKGFVEKPYNMRKLLTTVRDVLDED
ncbi:MAG: PAS domain S-box protein [Deltaproteobacteria bacterium]|nr:PAS domain S-box protein [Deltaproteobacteria bacterium]